VSFEAMLQLSTNLWCPYRLINNQREKYSFVFNGILEDDCSQEEVFERVCHPSLSNFMAGINATVFAYGQTGSGKTFTITGGPESYAGVSAHSWIRVCFMQLILTLCLCTDRGLIPRAISKVFDSMAQESQQLYTLLISYMEIYNHTAFDLLDPSREIKELADLPPVTILEDDDGKYHMRGLSLNRWPTENGHCTTVSHQSCLLSIPAGAACCQKWKYDPWCCNFFTWASFLCRASTAEEALNLLFLGDTNRMIAETPMNLASSRSHCVFTMHLEARRPGESVVRRSKLHLVDLAGSERVGRTGSDGTILAEAKYINASLHFLEQVIIALQAWRTLSSIRSCSLLLKIVPSHMHAPKHWSFLSVHACFTEGKLCKSYFTGDIEM
jgi:kinesin family member 6/9